MIFQFFCRKGLNEKYHKLLMENGNLIDFKNITIPEKLKMFGQSLIKKHRQNIGNNAILKDMETRNLIDFGNITNPEELKILGQMLIEKQKQNNHSTNLKENIRKIQNIDDNDLLKNMETICCRKLRTLYADETANKIREAGTFNKKELELLNTLHSVYVEKQYPDRWTLIQSTSFYLNGNYFSYEYNTGDEYKNVLEIDKTTLDFSHLFECRGTNHLGKYETFFNYNNKQFMNAIKTDVSRYASSANMTRNKYIKFIVKLMDIIAGQDCLVGYLGCCVETYVGKDIAYHKYDFENERVVKLHD